MSVRWLTAALAALVLVACSGNVDPQRAAIELPPGTPDDATAIATNNRGVALMGYFDYPAARDTFAELVARYPDWVDARVNLAIATLNRQEEGDEARAETLLTEALAQDPEHLRARFVAGLLKLYEGAQEEALGHFRFVASADPSDAYAAYYVGQLLLGQGDAEQALT